MAEYGLYRVRSKCIVVVIAIKIPNKMHHTGIMNDNFE